MLERGNWAYRIRSKPYRMLLGCANNLKFHAVKKGRLIFKFSTIGIGLGSCCCSQPVSEQHRLTFLLTASRLRFPISLHIDRLIKSTLFLGYRIDVINRITENVYSIFKSQQP